MKVLTPNFIKRLADANASYRALRSAGFRVMSCQVAPGDSLIKTQIEVAGGPCGDAVRMNDCIITRHVGGVRL